MPTKQQKSIKEEENGLFTEVLQIKVTKTMREQVESLASKDRRKVSEWLRLHLEDTIK